MSLITYITKGIFDRGQITDQTNPQDVPLTFDDLDDLLQDGEHTHIIHKTLKERVEDLEEEVRELREDIAF